MHILFDARLLHRPLSGLERVQRNLLRELAQREEIRRLQVLVQKGTQLPSTFPTRAEPVFVDSTEDAMAVLLAPDPAQRPDLLHMTFFPDRAPRDLWLPLAAKASVVEVHDAILNRHPEYHPDQASWRWYHSFVCTLVQCADRLLCHSESVRGEIERDLRGDPKRADVAPLAVEPALTVPLPAAEVERRLAALGVEGDYFLALGKDYPHKDHATLFRAMTRLRRPPMLICAGSQVWHGPDNTRTLQQQMKLEQRVRWLQDLDDEDVKALMQGSLALVYPSREEGFGLPPIEAMAVGAPVIASRAMSIPEVVGDGAWLFAPGNDGELAVLMDKVMAGGAPVEQLRRRGTRQAATYSWARCAGQTVACYRSAIAASRKANRGRPVLGPTLEAVLRVGVESPFQDVRELRAWQERCLSVENTLRELREAHGGGAPPTRAAAEPADEASPRWSLRRRLRKIRDGIRRSTSPKKAEP